MHLNSSPPPIPPSAKRNRGLRRVASVLLAICLITVITLAGYHWLLSSKIKSRLAGVRAAHEPVTLADLNQYYAQVPASSNAAFTYGRAFELLQNSNSSKFLEGLNKLPTGSGPLPVELRETMEKACQEHAEALAALEEAVKL